MLAKIPQYWKAIVGFLTPGVVALGVAVQDTSDAGATISRTELVGILGAMVLTGGFVAAKSNKPAGDEGAVDTGWLVALVCILGAIALAIYIAKNVHAG